MTDQEKHFGLKHQKNYLSKKYLKKKNTKSY